jgi:hypothetical protein
VTQRYLKEVEERRKRDSAALEQLNVQIEELQSEAALIGRAIEVYDRMLGTGGAKRQTRSLSSRAPLSGAGRRAGAKQAGLKRGSKTAALIEVLTRQGEKGATPVELYQGIEAAGLKEFGKPYLYTLLHKLKTSKRLKQKRGRYFLAE